MRKRNRERVTAEITLFHLMRFASESGRSVSRQQALAFLLLCMTESSCPENSHKCTGRNVARGDYEYSCLLLASLQLVRQSHSA